MRKKSEKTLPAPTPNSTDCLSLLKGVSSRMSFLRFVAATLTISASAAWAQLPQRPAVTGIAHMAVYTSDPAATERFYTKGLGAVKAQDPENPKGTIYRFSAAQAVEVLPLPEDHTLSRTDHVAFATADADAMRGYLAAHGVKDVTAVEHGPDGSRWFYARDPENNRIEFVQRAQAASPAAEPGAVSGRIIHVGFLVRDRAAEDRFYRELLGFRPYWYGAFHADKVDWVSQQVPDGHDWLEYMMAGPGSDTPDANKVDARQLGVMNHFSLGVVNMEAAVTRMIADDRLSLSPRHDGPQMGKDGKWQANLYDPDGTRVELMEFQPSVKPCCSPFTAESPAE